MDLNRLINYISEQQHEVFHLIDRLYGRNNHNGITNQIDDFHELYQMKPDSNLKVSFRYGPGRFEYNSFEEQIESSKGLEKINSNLIDGKFFIDKILYFENSYFLISHLINCCDLMVDLSNGNFTNEYVSVYLSIESLNIFESQIDKQKLNLLKNIDEKMNEMNFRLGEINSNIILGFKSLDSQLKSLNNKMSYNNILTSINTYQLYSLNKKIK